MHNHEPPDYDCPFCRNIHTGDGDFPVEILHRDDDVNVLIGCCNLIEHDGGYLLVRESKPSARARYNFPAGKPHVGETLAAAAVREAKEESGIDIEVTHLVGLYHCPQTSEGFGVVNFVFAASWVGGEIVETPTHPEVRFFTRDEVAALGQARKLRGTHIELAIDDHARGQQLPLDLVRAVAPSPF